MSSPGYFYEPEDAAQAEAFRRKRAYADALLRENAPQGAYGGLASAGSKIAAALLAKNADKAESDLAASASSKYAKSLATLLGGGNPATGGSSLPQATQASPQFDENGAAIAPASSPAAPVAPANPMLARILASGNPRLISQFAPTILEQQLKQAEPIKVGKNDRLFAPGKYDKPLIDVAPEPIDYNKPFLANGQPNPAYQQYELSKAATGRPVTNVSLNTEKSYAGTVAGELAKADAGILDAARTAPQRVQSAQAVLKILDTQKPITGTGANARLSLDKALATAGIIDGKDVTSTENLASELASQTLDAIKSSGLGSGQGFTDKDRQFLERARAGNIELNAGTLHYLARKNEQAARAAIQRGNQVARKLKGDKNFGSVGQDLEIPEPPEYAPPASVDDLVNKYLKK